VKELIQALITHPFAVYPVDFVNPIVPAEFQGLHYPVSKEGNDLHGFPDVFKNHGFLLKIGLQEILPPKLKFKA